MPTTPLTIPWHPDPALVGVYLCLSVLAFAWCAHECGAGGRESGR